MPLIANSSNVVAGFSYDSNQLVQGFDGSNGTITTNDSNAVAVAVEDGETFSP